MIPRAVQMAKAVVDSGLVDVATNGNILAPAGRGWTNNSVNYFTQPIAPAFWSPGSPFMAQPSVYTYGEGGEPLYRWFPIRSLSWFNYQDYVDAIVPSPFSAAPFPPPIGTLDPYGG